MRDLNIENGNSDNSTCMHDYLLITDGRSSSDTQLVKLCGSSRPNRVLTSTGTYMHVSFVSDGSGNGRGFKLHYTSGQLAISFLSAFSCSSFLSTYGLR